MPNHENKSESAGLLVVISGPSGVGKTTIAHEVEKRLGGVFSVSVTTRPRTHADVEGRDYYFLTEEQFADLREKGELLEWAEVFGKYKYGTPRAPVEQQLSTGKLVILEIDVQGGLQVIEAMPSAFMIFVTPPSEIELENRLRKRARDDEEVIQRRLAQARHEIDSAHASGKYDEFVVNENLETAIKTVCQLVQSRRSQMSANLSSP